MSTKTRLKLVYRRPTFLEGVSRVFDVLGVLKDDVRVHSIHHAYHHHRKSGSDNQSGVMTASPENVGTKAINVGFDRIHTNMVTVARKMRPSIPIRNNQSITK